MRNSFSPRLGSIVALALLLSACNLPAANETPEPIAPIETVNGIKLIATFTATEVVPTATSTETPVPEPSVTFTAAPPMAQVVRESNCRIGPGGLYTLVATYPLGQMLEVVAKDLGGGYWFVKNPDKPEEQCYLLAQNITIGGETTALPKFTPPPSPTAAPYFEVSFKKFDACEGSSFALFVVENVGSVIFRSAYVKVTNGKGGRSVEHSLNAFDLKVKCVLAKNIAPLNPGESGYVYSPPFPWSGHGEKLRAAIMLCADKNLKGPCVTRTLDIKE